MQQIHHNAALSKLPGQSAAWHDPPSGITAATQKFDRSHVGVKQRAQLRENRKQVKAFPAEASTMKDREQVTTQVQSESSMQQRFQRTTGELQSYLCQSEAYPGKYPGVEKSYGERRAALNMAVGGTQRSVLTASHVPPFMKTPSSAQKIPLLSNNHYHASSLHSDGAANSGPALTSGGGCLA